ncbi:extracellular solute-binding protein [Fontibacillus sp. BL9]|uniref:extracellular solute-binding protein n=1 Tax=Fontibacillus sp. BL9 TaxID=3389971 RepID=UPI00397BC812
MKRKNHWVLFAILLLALINLSPSETSTLMRSEDQGETEPITPQNLEKEQIPGKIYVAVQLPESDFSRLQQLNEEVADEYHIEVELSNLMAGKDYSAVRQELELGDSPDVLLLDNTWVRRFAAGGYLLPTESYYSGSLTGEVLSASLSQNEWNGYVWAVPMDADPYVWVYHPGKLKEMGTEFPASANGWQELINAFTKQPTSPFLFALDFNDPYAALSLMWQLTGQSKPPESASLFKKTEELEAAVQQLDALRPFLMDFRESGEEEQIWSRLYSGEIPLALVRWSDANRHQSPEIQIKYPDLEYSAGMWVEGRSFAVSARSNNKEAAGVWISAMTSQLQQRQWYELTGHLPVLKTMYYQASRNGLPSWIPASLVNGKGTPMPVGSGVPNLMERYAALSSSFFYGKLSSKSYLNELNEL